MLIRRCRGFTLIELLVVIAIIAILAAMLFPVFARARESARKIQCLSNVKNIATAVQMYLTDYDRFPPSLHDQAAQAYFDTGPGGGRPRENCGRAFNANPFLRWPVILDEYTRNRDVWRCPSTRFEVGAFFIVPDYGYGWWQYLQAQEGAWGTGLVVSPCAYAYPPGWGGTVTDSVQQQQLATPGAFPWVTGATTATAGAFDPGIGFNERGNSDLKTSAIADPALYMVCADLGMLPVIENAETVAYQLCGFRGGCADWEGCSWTQTCGLPSDLYDDFATDPTFRAKYTRHLGGSNLGFADGHATWMHAEALMANTPHCECCADETGYSDMIYHYEGNIRGFCGQPSG